MQAIEEIICSCGGKAHQEDATRKEEDEHGCGRSDCCLRVFKCDGCGVRWLIKFEAPEMRYS